MSDVRNNIADQRLRAWEFGQIRIQLMRGSDDDQIRDWAVAHQGRPWNGNRFAREIAFETPMKKRSQNKRPLGIFRARAAECGWERRYKYYQAPTSFEGRTGKVG